MYSTCLFCNRSLGANEVVESFPVGRRLAFDMAKGRLWVVCGKCERWNLSPMIERWEAVETCERLFRDTRMRASTENIGLARLREGLELVRIGAPQRPEFAAWRYGDQFGRRRTRAIFYGASATVAIGALAFGGVAIGLVSSGLLSQTGNLVSLFINARSIVKVRTPDGKVLKLRQADIDSVSFVPPSAAEEWRVILGKKQKHATFHGAEAERVASIIVPKMNLMGGSRAHVQDAVRQIEEAGGPGGFLSSPVLDPRASGPQLARARGRRAVTGRGPDGEPVLWVAGLPRPIRLALEMALHEEQEHRALQGELKALELAWQEAERIAAIADDLLLPAGAGEFLERHRSSSRI